MLNWCNLESFEKIERNDNMQVKGRIHRNFLAKLFQFVSDVVFILKSNIYYVASISGNVEIIYQNHLFKNVHNEEFPLSFWVLIVRSFIYS